MAPIRTETLAGGKVVKEVHKEGSGSTPPNGSRVTVHYTGTLTNGKKFDSSKDRAQPFSFKLGAGEVIKGWDVGVASMKKGEEAKLIIAPDYAYGNRAIGDLIPADSTLHFDVELLSF